MLFRSQGEFNNTGTGLHPIQGDLSTSHTLDVIAMPIDIKVSKCLLSIFALTGLQAGDNNSHTSFNSAFYAILFCVQ